MSDRRAAGGRSSHISKSDERPPAPWGNAPLAELAILAGIICLAIGVLGSHETLIGVGVGLAAVGGMEVAIREHFAGYRSHTTLLAGFVFVVVVGVLYYAAGLVLAYALPIGAVCFAVAFYLARRAFQRASGGLSFRIGGMRG
ncbi:MAG TPA: hypothetical protein VHB53_14015 [Solirubrobacterales bacterium]|nr:hypothetical protein [Solirubrobacterales bacterium]